MVMRRYEISLRVLKNISQVSTVNEWNILDKADTSNLSQRFMQNVLLDAIFWTIGSFKALISSKIFTINEIRIFLIITEWYLLLFAFSFAAIALKTKKLWWKSSS